MAKIVKTLFMYGEAFGAERLMPVTGKYGHAVISFGLEVMKPVYDLYDFFGCRVSGEKDDSNYAVALPRHKCLCVVSK